MKHAYLLILLCCLSIAVLGQTTVSTGFENGGAFPPTGWTITGSTGYLSAVSGTGGSPTTSGPHGGTYYCRFNSYSASSAVQAQLISPVVDWSARGGAATTVTIWWWRDVASYNTSTYDLEGVTAYVNTSATLTGATSMGYVPRRGGLGISGGVTGTSTTTTSGWYQYTFTVPTTFNSAVNYIIFNFYSKFGDNCFMDDVAYTAYPSCSAPAITGATTFCQGLTATVSDATTGGVWSSTTSSVATINSSTGVVTGVSAGTTNISYSVGGCLAGTTITVNPLPVATATATPATICGGSSSVLNVTATNPGATYTVTGISYSLTSQTSPTTVSGYSPSTDDGTVSISLPFSFTYWGTVYSSINVGTNGYLQLGGASTSYSVTTFPTSNIPGAIALFWGDLDVLSPGGVTYSTEGTAPNRKFVINYNQVSPCCSYSDSYDGQVVLYEGSNDIDILVSKAASGTHTCGIQNAAYSSFTTPAGRNGASYGITTPEAWRFHFQTPTFAWAPDATLSSTTIANPTAGPLASSHTYTAIATGTNGCPGTTTVTVSVNPPPTNLTGVFTVCQTGTTTLSSSAGGTWATSNASIATVTSGSTSTGIVTGVASGTATITYSFGSSCYVTQTVTVLATAPVTGPTQVCPGLTITVSDALSGGTWTSSNTSLATVVGGTGVVTGVAVGTPNIIYTLPNGCARSAAITVNPLPAAFTGTTTMCQGLSTTLTEGSTGGTWTSSSTTIATVGSTSSTTALVTGVAPGTAVITYTLPTTCIMTTSVLVNPLPVPITAPTAGVCVTDVNNPTITLVDGTSGGAWSSSNTSAATIVNFSGELTGLIPGSTTITYTLPTGCIITTAMNINPIPSPITGVMVVCANAVTYLNDPDIGGTWTTSSSALATVDAGTGIVTGTSGFSTPSISYTLPTGCVTLTTVTVNAAPGTVTGATDVCVGSTTNLVVGGGGTWVSSNPGLATVTAGPVGGGTVSGLLAGNPVITYTLPVTGCFSTTAMTVNPVPAAITPGTARVCYGNTITLNDATPGGVWSTSATVASVSGLGVVTTPVSVGVTTPAVINYTLATGCMATNAVSIDPLPIPYNLTNGGVTSYCAGAGGIDIQMNVTTIGVNYQLYNGAPVGSPVAGTGSNLDFGFQTAAGTYTAVAIDATTGCTNNMTGSPVINVNPLPTIYTLSYSGPTPSYCDAPGAPGVDLCLSGSQSGWLYELFINGNPGPFAYGTGSSVCFGPQTNGIYTVVATDPVTSCTSNMTGVVTIVKNALPLVHDVTVSDGGNYCSGGVGVHVGLDNANTGINYQLWLNGGTLVVTKSGANSSLDFGLQTTAGTYTVVAINAITGCTENMNGSAVVTVLPLPAQYTLRVVAGGASSYCIGGTGVNLELNNSDVGINYTLLFNGSAVPGYTNIPGTGSALNLGMHTASGSYTVVANDAITGCLKTMAGTVNVNVYPALTNFTVTVGGTGHYCATGAGVHVFMGTGSTLGVKYDLYDPTNTAVATRMGTGSTIDFGAFTTGGTYHVVATSTTTGCQATMPGSPVIVVDALPAVYNVTVTNGGNFCAGSGGVHIGLNFSDVGISYQLYRGGVALGSPMAGSSASLDFGAYTVAGTYTIIGTNDMTGCQSNMTGSPVVKINPVPTGYTVTGGGSYCAGSTTGVAVGLSGSQTTVIYQLFNNASPIGAPLTGTGTPLSFGFQTATGLYTVVAMDSITGCTNNFSSSKVITIDPLPTMFNVTGGGNYCSGGMGVHIGLDNSTTGVDYTLYNGTAIKTLHGTSGLALDFGLQTGGGTYSVVAKTVVSGCTSNMSGTPAIVINSLPAAYLVSGGGGYCAGDAGSDIYMSGSDAGVYYQVYNGGSAIGSPVPGTGIRLDLGMYTIAGTYTVVAYNAATGCTKNMTGSVNVSINALPTAYTITGGGTMCAGAGGFHVYLGGSQTGVSYQLMNGGVATGSAMTGTGAALDFGAQTAGGTYTINAVNNTTGCKNTMTGSSTIIVKPTPVAFAITGNGSYCKGGTGVAVGLTGSEPGVNYQLYNSATAVGMPVGGTGGVLSFGAQAKGIYTIQGMNMSSTCSNTMAGTATITENPGVVPSVTIKGSDGISCIGDVVNYTADPVNGGTPSYEWKVNGVTSGVGAAFSTIPVMGSVVSVVMTGSATCATAPTATSSITMATLPYVMPSAAVSVDPGASVCQGTPVSLIATPMFAGTLTGDWMKNSILVGSGTMYTYTPTSANDGDIIEYRVRSDYRCRMADTVFSDPVVMTVDAPAVPDFTIVSHLGPVIVGQVDTFIAAVKNTKNATFSYQWYVEGTAVPGATMPIYINHDVYNDDKVSCEVTRLGACGNQSATQQATVILKNLGTKPVSTTIADISVLPNPNKGEFTVKGSIGTNNDATVSLEVTNMLGQVVYTNKVMTHNGNINEHIRLSNTLANGMYILNLRSDEVSNVFHIVIEQ